MNINFAKGAEIEADVPFHLSFRFQEPERENSYMVVYNNRTNETWSWNEETATNMYEITNKFDLRVRRINNKFILFMDRIKSRSFEVREDFDQTTYLAIYGKALSKLNVLNIGKCGIWK